MKTYTASIFVELEIKVSGTLCDGIWEDITIEGIDYDGKPLLTMPEFVRGVLARNGALAAALQTFHTKAEHEFSEQIESALSEAVPDGPDPDDARDARIDRELMER